MNPRRRARAFALQALSAVDVGGGDATMLARLWDSRLEDDVETPEAPVSDEEAIFAREVVDGVLAARDTIDGRIEAVSHHWRIARMPLVDRNILRMGTWELLHRDDIPAPVTINEGLELAKTYGGADSRAFVNGVLDRMAGVLGRGGRAQAGKKK
jgi:N utilization substance protein B